MFLEEAKLASKDRFYFVGCWRGFVFTDLCAHQYRLARLFAWDSRSHIAPNSARLKPGSAVPFNRQFYGINLSLLIQPQNGDVR